MCAADKRTKAEILKENRKLRRKIAELESKVANAKRNAFWAADDAKTERTYHGEGGRI